MADVPVPRSPSPSSSAAPRFHQLEASEALRILDVDRDQGLRTDEVEKRRAEHGPNELEQAARTPAWKRFLSQFNDLLVLILLAAAVVSAVVSQEVKTPLVVLVVVFLNAIIGFVQERRAEASLDALRRMLVTHTRVRRNGESKVVPARELVPGDIVEVEAGDRVPADGRLLHAVHLEAEEAALTGESVPSEKGTAKVQGDAPVGDRHNMVFMNTTVTRGRGELVVTVTGMQTEMGRIAGMLREAKRDKTPLQRQLDGLAHSLARLAGLIVALVFAIGLLRGQGIADLLMTAVALAVASIPEGLPAVTAVTLAIGVSQMAKRNAIVKHLASVETLGCTTVICTDKTGTLTLNQMTAKEVSVGERSHTVTGSGYDPEGSIEPNEDGRELDCPDALYAMALCSDASVREDEEDGWQLVGDPTEGALVVLARKGGVDVAEVRSRYPRKTEVPFDSTRKFMATVHELPLESGPGTQLRLLAKGASEALLKHTSHVLDEHGERVPVDRARHALQDRGRELAERGMRVLALAQRKVPDDEWHRVRDGEQEASALMHDLTLLALVGIVDPPRPEARTAIEEARSAGIQVKMITGDHVATASAIGRQLGLTGRDGEALAVTGAELDRMSDTQLASRIDEISIFARVSPEHKLRLVSALRRRGEVVAMTGDGINDAPALKQADMGVAMGITGTEVTKEAATMVLADDNFATIVGAVRQGRAIYANIVKFVRFQLSTTLGFAAVFLGAAVVGLAQGQPFTAIAILWVNVIMDGPPAMALALDPGDEDLMRRPPRPQNEGILTPLRWSAIGLSALVMAAGTLGVLAFSPGGESGDGGATVAGTMALDTFVLFQFFNILNARCERGSVFRRHTLTNWKLWAALAVVLGLQVALTHWNLLQDLFETTAITKRQWLLCAVVASSVLWAEEIRKAVVRRMRPRLGGGHVTEPAFGR